MNELKPEDLILLGTVYTHPATGLVIGTSTGHTYHEGIGCPTFPNSPEPFMKEMFVVGMNYDVATQYYVKTPADILKLFEIVKEGSSETFIAVSPEAVKELMGDEFDEPV